MRRELGVMPELGEEVEAQSRLDTTCTTASLGRVALCNERFDQSAYLAFLIEPALS